MSEADVWVVIPNWNGARIISDCLQSLEVQSYSHQVVVVENGSTDSSTKLIKEKFPAVTLLEFPDNAGFAGGVNRGIRHAIKHNAEYIALLNNDAAADKDWLKNLVRSMNTNDKVGIVTGKLLRDDKKHFDSTGDYYSIRGIPFPRGRNQLDSGQYDDAESVFSASGGASLYRVAMLKEIGLFDERFFAYYEDVDISFRARLYGWDILYNPKSIAYHAVSSTSSKLGSFNHFHSNKNFYFLYIKNMPTKLFFKYLPSFLYQALRSAVSSLVHLHIVSYCKAIFSVLISLPSVLKDRYTIQKNKKVSDEEIDKLLHHSKPPISPHI